MSSCTGSSRFQSESFSWMPAPSTTERDTPGVSASCSGRKYSVPVDPTSAATRSGFFSPGSWIVILSLPSFWMDGSVVPSEFRRLL